MQNNLKNKFDFKLIEEFGSYNSARDKTTLLPNFLIRGSKNVYKKVSGTIASRPGLKRRGSADSTDAGVTSSFEWQTSKGHSRPLRVSNGKLEVESDIVTPGTYVWYELFATGAITTSLATTFTRWVFDTWWHAQEKKDIAIMVRGDDKIIHWSGGIGKVGSIGTVSGAVTGVVWTAGTGYEAGDLLTIPNGDGEAQIRLIAVDGTGAPTTIDFVNQGSGYSAAAGVSPTGGSGTGGTITITVGTVDAILTDSGNWTDYGFSEIYNEGKVVINGVEYTYIGISDNQLTGVTPSPASLVAGDVVVQSVIVADDEPLDGFECDFLKVIGNQILVGSYSSREIYISADVLGNGLFDFENAGSYVPGDPDKITLDNLAKGIGAQDGKAFIFAGDSDLYVVTLNSIPAISFTNPSESGARYIITKVEKKILPNLNSALGHEFIGNFGSDLVWLDQKNQVRSLGSVINIDRPIPVHVSLPIKEELSEDDFTGGHLRVIDDTVYITAPNNTRDWMYTVRETLTDDGGVTSEKIWHPPQVRGISRFAVIDGVIYGHSNANPQIYQVWDTDQWYDDNPDDEEIPYTCIARFPYQQHGKRQGMIVFDQIYFEGYMPEGVELLGNAYIDYQGASALQNFVINDETKPAKFWLGNPYPSLGDSPLGDNPLGDGIVPEGGDQELIPKFRKIVGLTGVNHFESSIEVYSIEVNSRWELLAWGTNVREATQQPVHIKAWDY